MHQIRMGGGCFKKETIQYIKRDTFMSENQVDNLNVYKHNGIPLFKVYKAF